MGQNVSSIEYDNYRDLAHASMLMQCFNHVKANFEKKNLIIPFEKFLFLVLADNDNVTTPYYPFLTPLFFNWSLMGG